ncbi:MAG TPA: hypothetical protein VK932_20195 [Kofleriaceae bacterium]|nr:hypothetical protein [Kofleriaceae bacterium]
MLADGYTANHDAIVATKAELQQQIKQVDDRLIEVDVKLTGKIDALDARLTGKIDALDTRLTGKIDALDTRLTGKIDALDTRLTGKIDALDTKLSLITTHLGIEEGLPSRPGGRARRASSAGPTRAGRGGRRG